MWKYSFPFLLVILSGHSVASDNPFLPPSQRDSAIAAAERASRIEADRADRHSEKADPRDDIYPGDAMTPDILELLNSKKDEAAEERYVGRMNGKDVYFSVNKGVYLYKE